MSILFDNPPPAIGCGDPGDPIEFGCLFDGAGYLVGPDASYTYENTPYVLCGWCKSSSINSLRQPIVAQRHPAQLSAHTWFGLENNTFTLYKLRFDQSTIDINLKWHGDIRDPSAPFQWHLLVDPSQPAESRFTLTVNGVEREKLPGATYSSGAFPHFFGSENPMRIGVRYLSSPTQHLNGYLSEVHAVWDALPSADEFGYFNSHNVWVPKTYTGPHGEFGFHLDFADPLDLGKDVSGNGNHFTSVDLTADNQVTDTPTNDFAVLNVSNPINLGPGVSSLSDGNLKSTGPAAANSGTIHLSTIAARKGKINAEVPLHAVSSANANVVLLPFSHEGGWPPPSGVVLTMYGSITNSILLDGVIIQSGLPAWASNNICGVEVDLDAHTVQFYRDDVPYGSLVSGIPDVATAIGIYTSRDGSGNVSVAEINYGQRPFTHPRGADFLTLSSQNMPCPDILNPDDYVTTRERTGGADVANLPWNPTIGKTFHMAKRLDTASNFRVTCSELGDNLAINCNVGGAEVASSHSFIAGGISVGADTEYQGQVFHQFWRASPKAGADFVLVEHVNGTPTMFAQATGGLFDYAEVYPLSGGDVRVFHKDMASGGYLILNDTGNGTDAGWLTRTANTGTLGAQMASGQYLIRMHRAVPQFCAVTSRKGTGVVDGMFVPMDFEPRIFVGKDGSDGLYNWALYCSDIAEGNPVSDALRFNLDTGLLGSVPIDMNSNGVKARNADNFINKLGVTYRCIAWARTPGKFARAR